MNVIESRCMNKKITISGGEPLEQMDSLLEFPKILKERSYDICVYTGWNLEQVPEGILENVNYLKTGSFVQELINTRNTYVGSDNQHMYQILKGHVQEIMR